MRSENTITHLFRLKPGQDLRAEVEAYVLRENIEAGWIMTCVGSLSHACLRLADQTEETKLDGPFEILSVSGTLSTNGCHMHMCISDRKGNVTGGHLLSGNLIYTTAEIVLGQAVDSVFDRQSDAVTGWKELVIREK